MKAASSDIYKLAKGLEIHWPTSVTLRRRLAPFTSSAHATQTYNQKHTTSNLCYPSDPSPLIPDPHIIENPSDASKRISLDIWPSVGIRKVWCKTHFPLSFHFMLYLFVTYTVQMSLSICPEIIRTWYFFEILLAFRQTATIVGCEPGLTP